MNSKQLQYFLTTVDKGSITAASRELDVAQPAISLQLANLEHELKTKLFNRDFRGVTLTENGGKFKQHAQMILSQILNAKADLTQGENGCKGKVVIGVSQATCNVLSADLLTELEHRHPAIELSFRVGPSYAVENWLAEKKVDIAIGYQSGARGSSTNTILLIKEALFLYMSHHPKNPSYSELVLYGSIPFLELKHYDIFMPDERDALTKYLNTQSSRLNIRLKRKKAFGQLMTTLHYVTQGLGLVICPSSAAFHLEQGKQLRKVNIIQPDLQRDVFLQIAEHQHLNPVVLAVFELIREVTAIAHQNRHWQGQLMDTKYFQQSMLNIESIVEG